MEIEGSRAGPSAAAVELMQAAAEPDPVERQSTEASDLCQPIDSAPATAHSRWLKPLSCYERRETTIVEGLRYG